MTGIEQAAHINVESVRTGKGGSLSDPPFPVPAVLRRSGLYEGMESNAFIYRLLKKRQEFSVQQLPLLR